MTIQLDGTVVSTTMRTPGNDYELAVGFCHTEGLLAGAPGHGRPLLRQRAGHRQPSSTSSRRDRWPGADADAAARHHVVELRLVRQRPDRCCARAPRPATERRADRRLRDGDRCPASRDGGQGLFTSTGAVHAAAAFDRDGTVLLTREDVGRHNAVDKVIGAMLLAGELPATGLRAVRQRTGERRDGAEGVGRRASARSSRSALPRRSPSTQPVGPNSMLVGFVRGDRFNVYSPERLAPQPTPVRQPSARQAPTIA